MLDGENLGVLDPVPFRPSAAGSAASSFALEPGGEGRHIRMGRIERLIRHMTWPDICRSEQYRGRWVALDNVRYDQGTSQPLEADVVDADEDLADLCARMRASDRTSCAILFVDEEAATLQSVRRPSPMPPRAAHR